MSADVLRFRRIQWRVSQAIRWTGYPPEVRWALARKYPCSTGERLFLRESGQVADPDSGISPRHR